MSTRQHPTNQANQAGVRFVLNKYSDDPVTSAYGWSKRMDNDEIWATEADRRTGWNKTFKSGTYRGMLHGVVLRGYPKQIVSLTTAMSVPTNMREFLSWAQRHYRIDVTASTVERKTSGPEFVGTCLGGCEEFSHKGSCAFSQVNVKDMWYRSKGRTSSAATRSSYMSLDTRTTGEATHTRERRAASIVEITLILFRV